MPKKVKYGIICIVILTAYAFGRYLQPAKIETKTETIVKEVEVIKRDVEIIKERETRTDGTVIEKEITRDKSTESRDTNKKDQSESLIESSPPQMRLRADVGFSFRDKDYIYGIGFEKRYIGPISFGLWGNNKEQAGISLSIEF